MKLLVIIMIEAIIQFILVFLVVWISYYVLVLRTIKKKVETKEYMELTYLKNLYHLDMRKVKKEKVMWIAVTINSFIIALTSTIVFLFQGFLIQMILAMLLLFAMIIFSYHILGTVLRKKAK